MAKDAGKTEASKSLEERLPIVIEVIPGAAEKGLPKMYRDNTDVVAGSTIGHILDEIVKQVPQNREEKSMMGLVNNEYGRTSKITINGRTVDPHSALVKDYLKERKTDAGNKYNYVAIKVLKPQEGGLYL